MSEPSTYDLFRASARSAIHLETRDSYMPSDKDWQEWQSGHRFDPAERWHNWFELMRETTERGVSVRRARIVSEPVSDYIRFEYDVTAGHNIAAGEEVRWLARQLAADLLVSPVDYWVFDDAVVVFNHFDGVGDWVRRERRDDANLAKSLTTSFEAVWERAVPHADYRIDR